MRPIVFCAGLLFIGIQSDLYAQVAVGYYPFQAELSISTHTERLLWGDLRLLTNTFWGNITTEPAVTINVKRSPIVNTYLGLGTNINFFNAASNLPLLNGYILYAGLRVKPIVALPQLRFILEVSPYVTPAFDGGLLRTRLGVAYQFGGFYVRSEKLEARDETRSMWPSASSV